MSNVDINIESNRSMSPQSSDYGSEHHPPLQHAYQTIDVGKVNFNTITGEILEATGEFHGNRTLTDTIYSIANTLRSHMMMRQSKDVFKGVTIQFTDHYYKIDMSSDSTNVHKYLLNIT